MRKVRLLVLVPILVWNAGNFIQFLSLLNSKFLLLFPILKPTYHLVCHQQADKLINIAGVTTLLCARCTGIYIGGLFGAIFFLIKLKPMRLPTKYLLYSSVPMFIDVGMVIAGVYGYSKPISFSTGVLLGSVGIVYLTDLIEKFLFLERSKK